ncbi:hypothetical protein RCO28_38145 [Streptomyces sp. LHD-70]|uniref:hypothetical protein n=1 Tax=Streptomyces sp. LHD-70 TaxID=3072140 RepID=UPI00280DE638|nr:hypothetical protein [Streptomyces sp. LHD-70]MDQ8708240.1 hypothetical protein [Streptomyces sp. LHD-70]
MARIRTIKPEAFASESLAAVSLSAERTFFGLLTQVDDRGRIRDQAAVIAGVLWSLRPEHGPMGVEDDLIQLASEDLICRYTGEDGKAYLHVVTWSKHQRINRPSGVRTPDCPRHDASGADATATAAAHAPLTAPSVNTHGTRAEVSRSMTDDRPVDWEFAGQLPISEGSVSAHGPLTEPSTSSHAPDLGPRNLDPGTTSPTGDASVPAQPTASARQLIAEYAAACAHRPPRDLLGHLGRETAKLIAEGVEPDHIRAGLTRHRAKGLHPSTLPSLVHEAMNAAPAGLARPGSTPNLAAHRPWANPANPAAAYAEEL